MIINIDIAINKKASKKIELFHFTGSLFSVKFIRTILDESNFTTCHN